MTKRLSPERIAEIRLHVIDADTIDALLGHIEAIESELTAYRYWHLNMSIEASRQEQRSIDAELELAEAKAKIVRLTYQIHDRDTLLKNENELYRQATERAEAAEARVRELEDTLELHKAVCGS